MRRFAGLFVLLTASGCGGEDANTVAKIGWQFDYHDYTDDGEEPDIRGCDNQPSANAGPAYRAIDKVRVVLKDPEGQIPGTDREFDCTVGTGDNRAPIRGVAKQVFALTIEAMTADGTVLYRYEDDEYDLATYQEDTYTIPTATGELHFFTTFNGSLTCPAGVEKTRYTLYQYQEGTPVTEPTLSGIHQPTCETGAGGEQPTEVFIREIPVTLVGPRDTFNSYKMVLEGLSSSDNVEYCGTNQNRVVHLGNNSFGSNENLVSGACTP